MSKNKVCQHADKKAALAAEPTPLNDIRIGDYTRKGLHLYRACYVQGELGTAKLVGGIIFTSEARTDVPRDVVLSSTKKGYRLEATQRQMVLWQEVGVMEYLLGMAQGGRGMMMATEAALKEVGTPEAEGQQPEKLQVQAKGNKAKANDPVPVPTSEEYHPEPEYPDCEPVWDDQY